MEKHQSTCQTQGFMWTGNEVELLFAYSTVMLINKYYKDNKNKSKLSGNYGIANML